MPQKSAEKSPRQEPPLQFRAGPDLAPLIHGFASEHRVTANEASKALAALALAELDCRYFSLVRQLGDALGGSVNSFVRACLDVRSALRGAAVSRGRPLCSEPERSVFIASFIRDFLAARGVELQTDDLWFMPVSEGPETTAHVDTDKDRQESRFRTPNRRQREVPNSGKIEQDRERVRVRT